MLGSWLEEYDELAGDVQNSNYQTFPLNVQRWLDFIDDHPLISAHIAAMEDSVDFDLWYKAALATFDGGAIGGGELNFPSDRRERVALQIQLFRSFGSGKIQVPDFALTFLYTEGNFHVQVSNIVQQIFAPFARELRRIIQKFPLSESSEADDAPLDRVIKLDHASPQYRELVDALHRIERAIVALNDYPEPDSKERHVAEMAAGETLLKPQHARVMAIWSTLRNPLLWFSKNFGEHEIGHLADAAWKILLSMIKQ